MLVVHQHATLTAGRIHSPDLRAAGIGLVAQVSKHLSVWTPNGVMKDATAQAGVAVDTLNGESLGRDGRLGSGPATRTGSYANRENRAAEQAGEPRVSIRAPCHNRHRAISFCAFLWPS